MNLAFIAVGGVAAHVLSLALAQYAQWLFAKVIRGEQGYAFLEDLRLFVCWFLRGLAGQLLDRRGWVAEEHDDWQPEMFGG